jgi:hypothetical protein
MVSMAVRSSPHLRAFGREQRGTAGDEALARAVGAGDLGEVDLVELGQLGRQARRAAHRPRPPLSE